MRTMYTIKRMIACLLCILFISVPAGSLSDGEASDLIGLYEIDEFWSKDAGDLTDQIPIMKTLGMNITILLRDNNTATLSMFGESVDLAFDPAVLTLTGGNGRPFAFYFENGKLVLADEANRMSFSKVDQAEQLNPDSDSDLQSQHPKRYEMVGLVSEKKGDMTEELSVMKEFGLIVSLFVYGDGTAVLDLFGVQIPFSFDYSSLTVTDENGESIPFIYENGIISISEGGNSLTFAPDDAAGTDQAA